MIICLRRRLSMVENSTSAVLRGLLRGTRTRRSSRFGFLEKSPRCERSRSGLSPVVSGPPCANDGACQRDPPPGKRSSIEAPVGHLVFLLLGKKSGAISPGTLLAERGADRLCFPRNSVAVGGAGKVAFALVGGGAFSATPFGNAQRTAPNGPAHRHRNRPRRLEETDPRNPAPASAFRPRASCPTATTIGEGLERLSIARGSRVRPDAQAHPRHRRSTRPRPARGKDGRRPWVSGDGLNPNRQEGSDLHPGKARSAPISAMKGGAAGGGLRPDRADGGDMNLHFTGDFHATHLGPQPPCRR